MYLIGKQTFKHLLLLFVVMGSAPCAAQRHTSFSLTTRNGVGTDLFREEGASPLTYTGPGISLGRDLTLDWKRYRLVWQQDASAAYNPDSRHTAAAISGTYHGGIGFLYQWSDPSCLRFRGWGGAGIGDQLFLSYNSALENAAVGYCNFLDADLLARVEWDFALRKQRAEKRFTAFGTLRLPIVSWMHRPGFSYLTNANTIDYNKLRIHDETYEKLWKALSGLQTGTGVAYCMRNHNRIALSYGWLFRSTGNKGLYHYHHAQHFLQCELTFNFMHIDHENQ